MMDPMPINELLNLSGVLAKYIPATAYDIDATTQRIPENVSKLLDGPTNTKSPAKPSRTPASFAKENSFLYRENNNKAVNIGTVA